MKKPIAIMILVGLILMLFTGCSSGSSYSSSSYNSSNSIRDTIGASYYDGLKDAFDKLDN